MKNSYFIENDRLVGGGSELVMHQIIEKLVKEGHKVTLAAYEGSSKECKQIFSKGVSFWKISAGQSHYTQNKKYTLQWILRKIAIAICRIKKFILSQKGFDVAIAMKEGPCLLDISRVKSKRKYGWVHVDYQGMHWTRKMFRSLEEEYELFRKMDQVICVSKTAENGIKAILGDPGNLVVAYNPINVQHIVEKAECKCPVSRKKSSNLIVAVGRLTWEKNFRLLLEVCAILRNEEFEVWILGEGPDRELLQKIIDENRLDFVKLLGSIENPYPYIRQADCFVSTSKTESYGLAVQEALILGVPVVVTDCPAMRETVPETYGSVIPANAEIIAQEIRRKVKKEEGQSPQYGNQQILFDDRIDLIYRILERE